MTTAVIAHTVLQSDARVAQRAMAVSATSCTNEQSVLGAIRELTAAVARLGMPDQRLICVFTGQEVHLVTRYSKPTN